MTRVYVTMVGDLFHVNHINLIKEAKEYGDYLIVGIHSDSSVEEYKCKPIMTLEERCYIISACKYVDSIIPGAPLNITEEFIKTKISSPVSDDLINPNPFELLKNFTVPSCIFT